MNMDHRGRGVLCVGERRQDAPDVLVAVIAGLQLGLCYGHRLAQDELPGDGKDSPVSTVRHPLTPDNSHEPCVEHGRDPAEDAGICLCWHFGSDVPNAERRDTTLDERAHRQPADLLGDADPSAYHERHVARDKADEYVLNGGEGHVHQRWCVGSCDRGGCADVEVHLCGGGLGAREVAASTCRKLGLREVEAFVQDGVVGDGVEVARLALSWHLGHADVAQEILRDQALEPCGYLGVRRRP